MTWLDRRLRERVVGALVLISLAVTFLPMLLTHEDESHSVRVEAPPMPTMPAAAISSMRPAQVPEPLPEAAPQRMETNTGKGSQGKAASTASASDSHLDANGLPVSWSIQLVSLSSRASAEALVQKLRGQGYSAYIRTVEGMNRVFVGPLVEKADAARLRDQLQHQHQLNGFVVRFQPERG